MWFGTPLDGKRGLGGVDSGRLRSFDISDVLAVAGAAGGLKGGGMRETLLDSVRERLEVRLESGASFAEVEGDLVLTPDLSEDERAALWLFAWSYQRAARRGGGCERVAALTG